MSAFNIEVESGKTVKLPTAGKYCDRDILVTAAGGGESDDSFWDIYQNYGNRTNYMNAFYGEGWNENTMSTLKYNIFDGGKSLSYAFNNCAFAGDFAEWMVSRGFGDTIVITSGSTQTFRAMSKVTRLPILDYSRFPSLVSLSYLFGMNNAMETIDKIILPSHETRTDWSYAFEANYNLKNIRFEGGYICKNISFYASSLLTTESVQSIIDCLKDLTGQTAQTLTLHADVGARLTDAQKATITAKNWTLVY